MRSVQKTGSDDRTTSHLLGSGRSTIGAGHNSWRCASMLIDERFVASR